ncbi:MAG: bifunctional 4-hydroxy-2-oxoglutarate aldolase/2-dehydro-3-deoxy-phosphogluconate aldolase [Victivallales bacterium]
MICKRKLLEALKEAGVVAVVRADEPGDLIDVSKALCHGGVKFIEITLTVPGALSVIEKAVKALGNDEVYIGAGTVLDAETARLAILTGASFIISPVFRPDVIAMCRRYDVAVMPGAMTPTEVLNAWEAGADVVKIFPAGVGGPQFFKDMKGPFPHIEIMPTGSVSRETAPLYIKAGACAVGVGGELAGKALIAAKDYKTITRNAQDFIGIVRIARNK